MRYNPEHKQETHERIVQAASRQFRGRGVDGIAIAELMGKLDLTHGGFYRHFGNKEQLLVEAVEKALEESAAKLVEAAEQAPPGCELKAIIELYLSPQHCENAAEGCPVAALATEITRCHRSVRTRIGRALRNHVGKFSKFLPGATETERRLNCAVLFSGMSGVLNVVRVSGDAESRKSILETAKQLYIKAFAR